jgi:hypothetical protein
LQDCQSRESPTALRIRSIFLGAISSDIVEMPVATPPGRERLAIWPSIVGSLVTKTIGTPLAAATAASVAALPDVTRMLTRAFSSSSTSAGGSAASPLA